MQNKNIDEINVYRVFSFQKTIFNLEITKLWLVICYMVYTVCKPILLITLWKLFQLQANSSPIPRIRKVSIIHTCDTGVSMQGNHGEWRSMRGKNCNSQPWQHVLAVSVRDLNVRKSQRTQKCKAQYNDKLTIKRECILL